jgi:PAS domain S-box-containing protein
MDKTLRILFVEDNISDAQLIWHEIEKNSMQFTKQLIDNKEDYVNALESACTDIIISDYSMPHFDGMTALRLRNKLCPLTPFILVTGSINEEVAVECMKSGADDYILKENLSRLGSAILNSLKKLTLTKEKKTVEEELFKSEQRLKKAQSLAHVGNWELDLSSKSVWFSDETLSIYGLEPGIYKLPYDKIKQFPLPEYREMLEEALDRLLKYNEPYDIEFKIRRENDSAVRQVYSKAEFIIEPDGNQVKVIGVLQDITDRKQAEEALKFNNLLLRTQQESSIDGILVVDDQNRIVNFNQRFIDIWGIPEGVIKSGADEPVLQFNLKQTANPEEFSKKVTDIYKLHTETSRDEVALKNGRTLDRYSSPMFGPDKKYYGRIWYFRDITDRKNGEEAISQERRMLRTLIDNIPDPIYVLDIEARKVIANKADLVNSGYSNELDVQGKTDLDLYPGETGERGYAFNKMVISTGHSIFDREEEFTDTKGSKRWLQSTKIPLRDKDGNVTGLVGIGHDITERKRVNAELRQSYAFSQSLLNTIPFGMHIVDESGNVIFQSDNFKRIFSEDTIGKKCWELYKDNKTQCTDCPLAKGISIGETEAYEASGVLGNRIFEINHTGMMYEGKKAMLEIFQDITERKENEQELIRAKEKAEEGDRLKTAFLHNISHEIRTPMNAIVGFSALLGEPDIDSQSRKSYIDVIMQSSNHLLSIITDIVDISNIEANLIKIVKSELNVNSTLKSLCGQFLPKANEKNIQLAWETIIPDSNALILTDRTKFTQILSNLVSNALKFTDKGSVKLSYCLKDNFLEFSVADTGIGIAPQFHEKIFDRFYQVQNGSSRLYEGTGLGLSISKAYVEMLGGKMWLSSQPDRGTTFSFTIPYERAVEAVVAAVTRKAPSGYVFSEKKVILIAEDVESNFKLIKYFLAGSNVEVIQAGNGKEAVEKFNSAAIVDLILMDIKMPVMDGYTAVRLIREKNNSVPIIAQTAYADDREKAIECGCSGFISKPFDKKALFKVLSEFI